MDIMDMVVSNITDVNGHRLTMALASVTMAHRLTMANAWVIMAHRLPKAIACDTMAIAWGKNSSGV